MTAGPSMGTSLYDNSSNMKTYLQKRIADIKAIKMTKRRERRYIAQLKRQGWANSDLWGLNTYLATLMVPMLKQFFKHLNGYPCNLKSAEEWQAIGAEMIWAMERYAKDDFFELADLQVGYTIAKCRDNKKKYKKWRAANNRLYARAQKGLKLFAEYFPNLWD